MASELVHSVYILANKPNGTLYIGSTSNLKARIKKHKQRSLRGFTEKYKVDMLVYYETVENVVEARKKETKIKRWRREWKIELIEKMNPEWKDLYNGFVDPESPP